MATVALAFWVVVIEFGACTLHKYSVSGAKNVFDLDPIQNPYCYNAFYVNPDLGLFFAIGEQTTPQLIRANMSS